MTIELPENYRVERDQMYHHPTYNKSVNGNTPMQVLADTGWYDWRTNKDAETDKQYVERFRVVLFKGANDPSVIVDRFSTTQPGGVLDFKRGYIPAKDKTPYLHQMRRIVTTYDFGMYLTGDHKNEWLHPRFTPVKEWMREIIAVENKRDKYVAIAKKKAMTEAIKKYPYNY